MTAPAESSTEPEQLDTAAELEEVGVPVDPEEETAATEEVVEESAPEPAPGDAVEPLEVEPEAEVEVEVDVVPESEVEPEAVDTAPEPEPEAIADAESVAEAPAPAPSPAPVRAPVLPGPPRTRLVTASPSNTSSWGRVDEDGTVSVREGDEWRVVGQYPDGTPDEALAYFGRKFSDLADKVSLLEQRHRAGGASAAELRTAAQHLHAELTDAAAVGDLAALSDRVSALTGELAEASKAEAAASREAVEAAIVERTALVERIEAIAAREPKSIQWKQTTTEVTTLFETWQSQQQNGPRLPRSTAQALWKRFRDARAIIDRHRREFYSELDEVHKSARDVKTRLIEKAEALAPKGEQGINDYRTLLDQWKASGRAGRKADDALWARFKAAGDALYSARAERDAAEAEESREKIAVRERLLEEARPILDESDVAKARQRLTAIQRRWDDVGRIFPRDRERALDDELRKIETSVRGREDSDWRKNNPETKARANDMTRQLTEAIDKLEAEVAAAKKAGDKRAQTQAEEALAARKLWLQALGG